MSCYFYLFYGLLDLNCGECYVISLFFCCVTLLVYMFVLCVACLTVFHQIIHNMYWRGCYFVVECYGCA